MLWMLTKTYININWHGKSVILTKVCQGWQDKNSQKNVGMRFDIGSEVADVNCEYSLTLNQCSLLKRKGTRFLQTVELQKDGAFCETAYSFQPSTIFAKSSILDVWLGSECVSDFNLWNILSCEIYWPESIVFLRFASDINRIQAN